MMRGLGLAAPLIPQWGKAAGRGSEVVLHRQPDSDNGASPKRASKYGLLVPAELAVDPAAAEIQESWDIHEATMGTGDQDESKTETGDWTGQHALLTRGMLEDSDKEWTPPERQRALTVCGHQGGEGGGETSPSSACLPHISRGCRGTPRHGSARS